MAPQLIATNGPSRRGERWWMARETTSLPVPDSPSTSTVVSKAATCSIMVRRVVTAGPVPVGPWSCTAPAWCSASSRFRLARRSRASICAWRSGASSGQMLASCRPCWWANVAASPSASSTGGGRLLPPSHAYSAVLAGLSSRLPTITAIQSFWRWRPRSKSAASETQRGLKSMNSSRATVRSARTASLSSTRMRDSLTIYPP